MILVGVSRLSCLGLTRIPCLEETDIDRQCSTQQSSSTQVMGNGQWQWQREQDIGDAQSDLQGQQSQQKPDPETPARPSSAY